MKTLKTLLTILVVVSFLFAPSIRVQAYNVNVSNQQLIDLLKQVIVLLTKQVEDLQKRVAAMKAQQQIVRELPKVQTPTPIDSSTPQITQPELTPGINSMEDSWPNCKYNPWKDLPLNQQQEIISHYATRNGCPIPPAPRLDSIPPASP